MATELIVVEIEMDETMSWKKLRTNLRAAVDETKGVKFIGISTWSVPDPFKLPDPDDPPEGFC